MTYTYNESNSNGAVNDAKAPHAVSLTTPPRDTFHEAKLAPGGGMLMYWPEQNSFLALFPEEYREFYVEADEHSKKIAQLQAANQKVTEAAIALRAAHKSGVKADMQKAEATLQQAISDMRQASDEVKKTVEPLSKLDAKEGVKMVELVSLKTPKYKSKPVPIYVKSTTLKKVLADKRIYLLEGEKEKRPEQKLFKNGKLNIKEIKLRIVDQVQDKAKFSKEWTLKPEDAEAYSGVLFDWARTMNADTIATFIERHKDDFEKKFNIDPKDSSRNIDLSADAQMMRYTGGAGLEANFNPFKGNLFDKRDKTWSKRVKRGVKAGEFGIKANAHASFAFAEGRIRTEVYWPHYAGYHAMPKVADQTFELGYWRFYGDIILSGGAGASVVIEADLGISYTGGKQGLRGIPLVNRNEPGVKARAGASAELDCFAGVRGSIDAKGALQWLNPEGADSDGQPLKVKPGEAVAEYKDMAKVDAGVAGMAGLGIKGAFKIRHEKGKFIIYAKLGACLGLGGDATLAFETGYETIGEFFKCVAYQLKRADFHKIDDAIEADAYKAYCQIRYLIIAKGRKIEEFVVKQTVELKREFDRVMRQIDDAIKNGSKEAEEFIQHIHKELSKQTGSWFSYAPPEVVGQIQRQIAAIGLSDNPALQQQAPELMAMALGAPQTMNQLATIAERMTPAMGEKQDMLAGLAMINACVAGTSYSNCLGAAQHRLASVQPLNSKPFIWNSEPEFIAASLGIEHPMFA